MEDEFLHAGSVESPLSKDVPAVSCIVRYKYRSGSLVVPWLMCRLSVTQCLPEVTSGCTCH